VRTPLTLREAILSTFVNSPMLKKILSVFLLLVFFIETTPDDLWHLFAHHHDTHEVYFSEPAVGIKHIHCEALQLTLPEFNKAESTDLPATIFLVASYYTIIHQPAVPIHDVAAKGRAPPGVA
jgi:hypothetical protein